MDKVYQVLQYFNKSDNLCSLDFALYDNQVCNDSQVPSQIRKKNKKSLVTQKLHYFYFTYAPTALAI